jgi:hypothetical protein
MYRCRVCQTDLCQFCKPIHNQAHNIINYDKKIIYLRIYLISNILDKQAIKKNLKFVFFIYYLMTFYLK